MRARASAVGVWILLGLVSRGYSYSGLLLGLRDTCKGATRWIPKTPVHMLLSSLPTFCHPAGIVVHPRVFLVRGFCVQAGVLGAVTAAILGSSLPYGCNCVVRRMAAREQPRRERQTALI